MKNQRKNNNTDNSTGYDGDIDSDSINQSIFYFSNLAQQDLEISRANEFLNETAYKNGDIYQGKTKNKKKYGKGIYISKNGTEYKGLWIDDIFNSGLIIIPRKNLTSLELQYENTNITSTIPQQVKDLTIKLPNDRTLFVKHAVINSEGITGYLKIQYHNHLDQRCYEGEVKNGKFFDCGTVLYHLNKSCIKYQGQFKNEKRHGVGKIVTHDSLSQTTYVGEFENDILKEAVVYIRNQPQITNLKYKNNKIISESNIKVKYLNFTLPDGSSIFIKKGHIDFNGITGLIDPDLYKYDYIDSNDEDYQMRYEYWIDGKIKVPQISEEQYDEIIKQDKFKAKEEDLQKQSQKQLISDNIFVKCFKKPKSSVQNPKNTQLELKNVRNNL